MAESVAMPRPTDGPGSATEPGTWDTPTTGEADHLPSGFARQWRMFMRTRSLIAGVLLALEGFVIATGAGGPDWLLWVCGLYLGACLGTQWRLASTERGGRQPWHWLATIGLDVLTFALLEHYQQGDISFVPLFALPVLMAAVLGPLTLAMATAASATLFLLGHTVLTVPLLTEVSTARLLQSGLTGTGFFLVALLTHALAGRLVREEALAQRSLASAQMQTQVNERIIEGISEGVLVVDAQGQVRNANPAARAMLSADNSSWPCGRLLLSDVLGWQGLVHLVEQSFADEKPLQAQVCIESDGLTSHSLFVRTQLTASQGGRQARLCVLFMEDLREMEARVRTEKLASMGRLSAAVAHEIRNPLSAITQANALLDEEVQSPAHKRLTRMIDQNAQRLSRIVDDILNVARVQPSAQLYAQAQLALDDGVRHIVQEWRQQHQAGHVLRMHLHAPDAQVRFDAEHLRRVLINLLDNAWRYRSSEAAEIRVITQLLGPQDSSLRLSVWSQGGPLESSVQRHLFEPFFSSESRSSGLGLYLCRELCERYGVRIGYRRSRLDQRDGNEFYLTMPAVRNGASGQPPLPVLSSRWPVDASLPPDLSTVI